jgi:hypothetical protein
VLPDEHVPHAREKGRLSPSNRTIFDKKTTFLYPELVLSHQKRGFCLPSSISIKTNQSPVIF